MLFCVEDFVVVDFDFFGYGESWGDLWFGGMVGIVELVFELV